MDNPVPAPGFRARLAALSFYAGLAPAAWLLRRRLASSFLEHHARQSLGIFVLLGGAMLFFLLAIGISSYSLVHFRETYESLNLELWMLWVSRKLFLCWLVFWVYGAGLALWGSPNPLPLVWRIQRRNRWMHLAAGVGLGLYLLSMVVGGFAQYAGSYCRSDAAPGAVYMVYEDAGKFPRWLFVIGFYPLARASGEIFGPDKAVLLPLSKENMARAFAEARFVFLGTHGGKAGVLLKNNYYMPPSEVAEMGTNPGLEYVYLTSCDSGTQREAWEKALAPAHVVTFDRLTAVAEHIWWLWFEGPRIVRSLNPAQPKIAG